jgi:hypothetical protein
MVWLRIRSRRTHEHSIDLRIPEMADKFRFPERLLAIKDELFSLELVYFETGIRNCVLSKYSSTWGT